MQALRHAVAPNAKIAGGSVGFPKIWVTGPAAAAN